MSFKDDLNKEVAELKKVKKPYETAAFILFAILILQQLVYLVKSLIDFIGGTTTWFSATGWCTSNLMGYVTRILNLGSSKWGYIILAIVAYLLYYFLIYIFVWNYSKKRNLAKWTWTLLVVFGPAILLMPSYIWFVIYAFRPYLARFAKKMVQEFKEYNPNEPMPEDIPDPVVEEKKPKVSETPKGDISE